MELIPPRRLLHNHLPSHAIPARAEERPQDRRADDGGRGRRQQQFEGIRGGSGRERRWAEKWGWFADDAGS